MDDDSAEEVREHRGVCTCGVQFEFTTQIVRGFADLVEAYCPSCGRSLGEFREDVGGTILVKSIDPPATPES